MRLVFKAALLSLPFSLIVTVSQAVEVMQWKRLPLAIPLFVGQERVIFIDRNVRVGVPAELGERLRVQSAAGTVYLRANETIEPTRLQLQDAVTGELILLDIMALESKPGQAPLEDVRVIAQASEAPSPATAPATKQSERETEPAPRTPIPVALTRYAAQNLYAPLRTVEPLPGVRRVNVTKDLSLDLLIPSLPVQAKALAAWRLDGYWVTAVHLSNLSPAPIDLDPRLLLGDFATATFQHLHLGPKGDPAEATVAYITTHNHGLGRSLLPTISPIDAALNLETPPVEKASESRDEK
ncbi:TIGR03749 family integrating conjugative element protein [Pseudomonas granadensis]|uniref:TIGR03749 family integrating conjugative element protein n=1 Tax=Pseudomonas granadensis TaxID=1421430 RepID=A0ABX7G9A7_9PSED|nr:TIGR03749 family integrating conjugative element protein [Pseudomonas granadensis]QRK81796.1 TIGR03749 family integrating conjugative element protein [Pseudomonas granadensis]